MSAGRRPLPPVILIAALGLLTGTAAWLGVAGSPTGRAPSAWQSFVSSTTAAGTVAFRSVVTTTGASDSVERAYGVLDFVRRAATEVSVVQGPGSPAQWNEVVVFGGTAYERPGSDGGGARFNGTWTPLPSFVVSPFAPLSGDSQDAPALGGPSLRRVGATSVGGVATTEYVLTPVGITCEGSGGGQRSENVSSTVWVDDSGRIVKFENLTAVAVAGVQSAVLTVTTFDGFGLPVTVDSPRRVASAPVRPAPVSDPLAGCLLTPG